MMLICEELELMGVSMQRDKIRYLAMGIEAVVTQP